MNDTLVSARISKAKKDAGAEVLANIGATTSDLINSAFDYLLANKALPLRVQKEIPSTQDFFAFLNETTLKVDWGALAPEDDYKSIMRHNRVKDYESID